MLLRFCTHLFALALGTGLLAACAREPYGPADARPPAQAAQPLLIGADSVRGAAAGRYYDRHGALYQVLLGHHYRRVWAAPVAAPVLDPTRGAPGGGLLRPRKAGGGFQTISLGLEGPDGREYSLRALDKDPRRTLPPWLRRTFVLNAVRDATSAGNPYAALVVPPLAAAVGVRHGTPHLVYVRPDEAGLGETSDRFRGRLALLEEKASGRAAEVLSTQEMLARCAEGPGRAVDALMFLRARLLDLWLGDWDRHGKQWNWAAVRSAGGVRFEPIPKDRDQVFFRFDDGVLPRLVSWLVPKFQTFGPRFGNVRGLARQGRFLDRHALAPATGDDFLRAAAAMQRSLPDSLLARAVRRLPPAVYALEGPRTLAALQARRAALPVAAARYYRSLARRPAVSGTAQAERFVVRRYPDSVAVAVYAAPGAAGAAPFYRRTFRPAETRVLTLDGRGGSDAFDVYTAPGRVARLRLAVMGGPGPVRLTTSGSRQRILCEAGSVGHKHPHPSQTTR